MAKIEWVATARDWLDARLPLPFDQAFEWLAQGARGEWLPDNPPQRTGYKKGVRVNGSAAFGSVKLWGQHPQAVEWSMLSGTGGSAVWAHDLAAGADWADRVQANRVDVCVDFLVNEKAFDKMFENSVAFCRHRKLAALPMGLPENGRTLYFNRYVREGLAKTGNEKAPAYSARLYEKGKQTGQDPDWRRFELSIRPDKGPSKRKAFMSTVDEGLGSVTWSRDFLRGIGYVGAKVPERSSPTAAPGAVSDEAEAARAMWTLAHMGAQYGAAAQKLEALVGPAEAERLVICALFNRTPDGEPLDEGRGIFDLRTNAMVLWSGIYEEAVRRREQRH